MIFMALREWLVTSSRVLLLDPTHGEYAHVCDNIIGCRVDCLRLSESDGFVVDLELLAKEVEKGYDLVVLVNPNNRTGRHIPKPELKRLLEAPPASTIFWIDETYVDYVGSDQSLERSASKSSNMFVCQSMSKAYTLSALRGGYLCGDSEVIIDLRRVTPPWEVSLPGEIAGVAALQEPEYYVRSYAETALLRKGACRRAECYWLRVDHPCCRQIPAVPSPCVLSFQGCGVRTLRRSGSVPQRPV